MPFLVMPEGLVCGVDEAGRGALVASVVAAAVILDPENPVEGLNDSKKLSARKRENLAREIKEKALAWSVAEADREEIEHLNILQASLLAMERAVAGLKFPPARALIDGNCYPRLACPAEAIVGGDGKVAPIAAASILAKTTRDAAMLLLHEKYPEYGFDRNKGYPTAEHLESLQKYGASPEHRRTYAPVAQLRLL